MRFIENLILHLVNYFGVLMKQVHHIIMEKMLVFVLVMELIIILINVCLHNIHNKIKVNQEVKHFEKKTYILLVTYFLKSSHYF